MNEYQSSINKGQPWHVPCLRYTRTCMFITSADCVDPSMVKIPSIYRNIHPVLSVVVAIVTAGDEEVKPQPEILPLLIRGMLPFISQIIILLILLWFWCIGNKTRVVVSR